MPLLSVRGFPEEYLKKIPPSYWFQYFEPDPADYPSERLYLHALRTEQAIQRGELVRFPSIKTLTQFFKDIHYKRTRQQDPKIKARYDYTQGPMYYLGQKIVRGMQDAGYPAKILYCHRSAALQATLYAQGRHGSKEPIVTRARPWFSAHQYLEAVDIIHPTLAWKVKEDYWTTLAAVVRTVADKYGVDLRHGHDWDGDGVPVHMDPDERFRDSAHIELADWRKVRDRMLDMFHDRDMIPRPPSEGELWLRFEEVLPRVAKQHQKTQAWENRKQALLSWFELEDIRRKFADD